MVPHGESGGDVLLEVGLLPEDAPVLLHLFPAKLQVSAGVLKIRE
jgi:hypothetical protein